MGEAKLIESKGFKDNYGKFMIYGGMYSQKWWITAVILAMYGIHAVFLANTVFLAGDDVKLMGESAHFTVFRFMAMIGIVNARIRKPQLKTLFTYLGADHNVHDYGNTLSKTCKAKVEQVKKDSASRKKFRADGFAKLVTGAFVMLGLRALLDYYNGHLNHPKREDGINRNLPVASYMPYECEEWPGYHIALLSEIGLAMQGYFTVVGHDCAFICFSEDILRELELVVITLKELEGRSEHLRREMSNKISKDDSVRLCLRHSVQHHQKAIKLFNLLQDYAYWTLFATMSGGAFLICLSALILTSEKIKLEDKSAFMLFLGDELFHIFIFCYYGENIMLKSVEIGDSLYQSTLLELPKVVRQGFSMIKFRTRSPLTLTAGGFMAASFDTYSNVLRTAYSYLNLLQATSQ